MKLRFNAVTVMWGLLLSLLVIAALGSVVFYYGTMYLKSLSASVDHASIDAEVSVEEINRLKKLQAYLVERQVYIERVSSVTADSSQFQFQNKLIDDIKAMSESASVPVSGYTIDALTDPAKAGAQVKTTAPTDTRLVRISLTIGSGVQYESFLKFLRALEQNLTRVQVTDVTFTPETDNPKMLSAPSMSIEAYVR